MSDIEITANSRGCLRCFDPHPFAHTWTMQYPMRCQYFRVLIHLNYFSCIIFVLSGFKDQNFKINTGV